MRINIVQALPPGSGSKAQPRKNVEEDLNAYIIMPNC